MASKRPGVSTVASEVVSRKGKVSPERARAIVAAKRREASVKRTPPGVSRARKK
jgi:hypothetical protein